MSEQINVPGLLEQQAQQATPATAKTMVSIHDRLVVLHFERSVEYAVYSPAGAISDGAKMMMFAAEADPEMAQLVINVSMAIVDAIYEARGDIKPAGGAMKKELIERDRRTLTDRLTVVLNSAREKKTISNRSLARQVVDICLAKVLV